jgi:hypothetical protein
MLRQLRPIIIINFILVLIFVYADYSIGNIFNRYPDSLYSINWSPFLIQYNLAGAFVNGNWVAVGAFGDMVNFPFWLFFVSTVVNLFFIVRLVREKETQQKPT